MKRFLKFAVPLLFLIIGISVVLLFEFQIKDKVNTTQVLVAKNDISFKQLITEDDIQVLNVKTDHVISNAYKPEDINLIIDKHASIEISKGTQLYSSLIDQYNLIPNEEEGEFIAPIPNSWLFAVPGSLRRTFIADFYAIPDKEQAILRSLLNEVQQETGEAKAEGTDEEELNEEDDSSNNMNTEDEEIIDSDELEESLITANNKPILKDIRVASVKDNSNREIGNATDPNAQQGVITNLEVIANDEILDTLRNYTEQGYKIYVVYKYGR